MHCELVVPALFSRQSPSRVPSLEILLARGRRSAGEPMALESWLGHAFDAESAPAGALTALAADAEAGEAAWMRADPVHLRLMRDRAVVMPAEALSLSREEADALLASLAALLELKAYDPHRWYARVEKEFAVQGAPALESAGRQVAAQGGADALLTEVQMMLHGHPVNEAREARGEPAANSLWLWGAGRLPGDLPRAAWATVLADEPVALGLARACGVRGRPLPRTAAQWLAQAPDEGRHLMVLDALRSPAALEDDAAFGAALQALERDWFAPLLEALRAGRIGMASVHVPDGGGAAAFETIRGDLRRFWRRPRAMERYA